ncbi:MAG: hypothetical protein UV56_C0006G0003 [Candidatus Woesebacteria bacterium GW2011_GWC1_43_10b]|uniref:Pyrrolo-quinoline quinone repeat domain-containing protein n=3 Tax=Candidatus Woeseibacteriota TaxID=1752722 RepID=A0A1F7WMU1_9BACT|nr:MAG: hypothetical protein UV56_C0006G0003 [Candidatus Woesebacteria bacterium GW2011_GWC1_43_10b]KKS98046.1 MAG: hypothetical protein UV74_C0006G0003 [Candidatus Woesebacteria bacterium GW2011_GWB1_43_14]OGM04153.1 MAG: hypothetical protein A2112_02085 [Candidatus Woesebacteria bacterium GWA1_42_12]
MQFKKRSTIGIIIGIIPLLLFFFFKLLTGSISAQTISLVSPNPQTVRVYEKYELKFNVNTASNYPFFQYDENPPSGIAPRIGVSVEGVFTAPSGQILRQPAFYTTEVSKVGTGSSMYFEETSNKYWVIRFSPQEIGTYQVSVSVQDASGITSQQIGTFNATAPNKDGFIKVSSSDPRYFEFTNGRIYWPIGPAWNTNNDYSKYKDTGQNLERVWMGGFGAYSTNFARWISSAERHGNEGIATRLNYAEHLPGHELSYEIFYPEGFRIWIPRWQNDAFAPRFKANTTYQVKLVLKSVNIAGPNNSSYPYGLVARAHNFLSHETAILETENTLRSSPIILGHVNSNQDWRTINTTFTTGSSVYTDVSLYLDNVTAGQVYIDEFSIKEVLPGGGVGGEKIRNPSADLHTYVDPRAAAFFDWQVEEGEKNGVFFKYVVHDKNDWIQNHLNAQGQFVSSDQDGGYYQEENTKARWLLRQWYRYLIGRWGYSTAIQSWELNNEGPPNEDPPGSGSAPHWRTAQAFAKFMHDEDSHPHLATTSLWCCWRPKLWENEILFPDIDYADVHDYSNNSALTEYSGKAATTNDEANWVIETGAMVAEDAIGKPILAGETGLTASSGAPVAELQQANSGVWYHNMLWTELAAGFVFKPNYWWQEHINFIEKEQISTPFNLFIGNLDLNKGGYVDAGATSANSGLRIVGQKNTSKGKAVLWIQNKNHTWKNVFDGTVITPISDSVNTPGLAANTDYKVEFWDTYLGTASVQTIKSASDGTFSIPVSNLTTDIAVKIGDFSTTSSGIRGDANSDGKVDNLDYNIWLSSYTKFTAAGSVEGDFDVNGVVDGIDYTIWFNNYGGVASPTPTTAVSTPTPSPTSTPGPTIAPAVPGEWTQHGHDAQHTNYTDQIITPPWRWKWSWNGPDASGNTVPGKFSIPINVQPVTGGGRVYVAAGDKGVFALAEADGSEVWNANPGGNMNSTVAYDSETSSVFSLSANGTLYKFNSGSGSVTGQFATGSTNELPLPPAIAGSRVYISMGNSVYAIDKNTMQQIWQYNAGSQVDTPPAYSSGKNVVVAVSQDLFVHGINVSDGTRRWRVKPTTRTGGSIGTSNNKSIAEAAYGWPVIAEAHGYVMVKYRLDWNSLWTWSPWPTDNASIRTNLTTTPGEQVLFVMKLEDGSVPFIANVGNGSWGDNNYLPMGPQPVVKRFSDGTEVAYMAIRGDSRYDGRWDSHFGELILDNSLPNWQEGQVRWIQYGNWGWPLVSNHDFPPTDEHPFLSMAGNYLFGGHWALGLSLQINNRDGSLGTYQSPITSSALPHFVSSTSVVAYTSKHYSPNMIAATGGGTDWRPVPYGFYIYNDSVGRIWDEYWGGYSVWVVSNNQVYYRSPDGAIIALEAGDPLASTPKEKVQEVLAGITNFIGGLFAPVVPQSLGAQDTAFSEVISYEKASEFSGKTGTVEGEVKTIFNNGKSVLLGFADPHVGVFKIQILKKDWKNFGEGFGAEMGEDKESLYRQGQRVQVTGKIEWYQGDPVIYVTTPFQIKIVK